MAINSNYHCYGGYLILCLVLLVAQFGEGGDDGCSSITKKLIIGVPNKSGFPEFVDAQLSPTNKSQLVKVIGYSIDVFIATVHHLHSLGCDISFEFQAFANDDGNSAGTYDNLLDQIGERKYDAVVGDITIVANRSKYVDFTLPYAESHVMMLVKVGHDRHLNMWIFLSPFSWDLWLSILVFCIFVGGIIRFMERNTIVNGDRDGGVENSSLHTQRLTTVSVFWLPLAQMVIPQRESIIVRNCSRFVLVLWMILAFVLAQSYTASLSSILTVDQLKPNYPKVNDLRRHHEINVGYLCDSFVRDLLVDPQALNFEEARLRNYSGIEEYKDALDKGSRNGGVDAIFDEVPYIKVFLNQYGSKNYAMVGPRFRTDGFGFAFSRGSKLTSYFSRAILNVTESKEMDEIERKYFGNSEGLEDQSNSSSEYSETPSLSTYSFAGLFMVIGVLTFLAVLVSESRIWLKHVMLPKTYSQEMLTRSSRKATHHQSKETSRTASGNIVGLADEPNIHPILRSRSLSSIDIGMLPV